MDNKPQPYYFKNRNTFTLYFQLRNKSLQFSSYLPN